MILLTDENGVVVQTIEGDDMSAFTEEDRLTPHLSKSKRVGLGWVRKGGRFIPPSVTAEIAAEAMERRIAADLPPSRQARAVASGHGDALLAYLDAMAASAKALEGKNQDPAEDKHWPSPVEFGL